MSESTRLGGTIGAAAHAGKRAAAVVAPDVPYHLALCLPLVFVLGSFSLFATRLIHWVYHPEQWVGTSPSISGTSSEPPGSTFFFAMMLATALCILISWSLVLRMNAERLRTQPPSRRRTGLAVLNVAACGTGMFAGLTLAALGGVNLSVGHDFHMAASYAFYISQVLSFLLDGGNAVALRRLCPGLDGPIERRTVRSKLIVGVTSLVCALFFLFMYLVRDHLDPASLYRAQAIYVASEYTVALICFAYPLTSFAEIRRHYRLAMAALPAGRAAAR
jgi:hypothetical protein